MSIYVFDMSNVSDLAASRFQKACLCSPRHKAMLVTINEDRC